MSLSKFAEKRIGTLNRFYTRSIVGSLIATQLGNLSPNSVLDLGAGEGSLSSAVAERWPSAKFVTADIDSFSTARLRITLADAGVVAHEHYAANVLEKEILPWGQGKFDLAVCNPPFFRTTLRVEHANILKDANLWHSIKPAEITAELLFLAQNLRSIRIGGTLAFIAPDGMMTTRRMAPLRRALLSQHLIKTVIQLPNNAFQHTDAYCFIFIIEKESGPSKEIGLQRYSRDGVLSSPLYISLEAGIDRLDHSFYATQKSIDPNAVTLRRLDAEIRRGSLGSIDIKGASYPTFHTTDYTTKKISFDGEFPRNLSSKIVIADKGDILVARIDRNFHKKVAIVSEGSAVITDCIYRIRLPLQLQEAVFEALISPMGAASMKAVSKGVSARLLGKADLLDLSLSGKKLRFIAEKLFQKREGLSLLL